MKRFVGATAAAVTSALVASASFSAAGVAAAQTPQAAPAQAKGPDLQALLHLRPDQMTAYHAVEAADRESPTELAQLRAKAQRLATAPFPQRLDFESEVLNLRVAHAHRVWEAQRKFYAVLSPEQQHTFDQLTAPRPQQGAAAH